MYSFRGRRIRKKLQKKRLTASFDTIFLAHVENLLRQAGIPAEQRNQFSAGGLGELPAMDVMPELWVEATAYTKADDILSQVIRDRDINEKPVWICPQCGESIEGQFSQCWQCGHWLEEEK